MGLGGEEGQEGEEAQGCRREGQEEEEAPHRVVQHLHLQGSQAGAPRHRHLHKGHVNHELVHFGHLRQDRQRGRQARPLQQEGHPHLARDPDCRAPSFADLQVGVSASLFEDAAGEASDAETASRYNM